MARVAPERFTFFQNVFDQAFAIDFGQFEGAESEFESQCMIFFSF